MFLFSFSCSTSFLYPSISSSSPLFLCCDRCLIFPVVLTSTAGVCLFKGDEECRAFSVDTHTHTSAVCGHNLKLKLNCVVKMQSNKTNKRNSTKARERKGVKNLLSIISHRPSGLIDIHAHSSMARHFRQHSHQMRKYVLSAWSEVQRLCFSCSGRPNKDP